MSFISWYIGNMPCASFYERKLLNFKNCADHRLAPYRELISGRSYKPGVYRCAIQCISQLYVWVCYYHSIRGNVKFITNFRLSLAQVNWNFVNRFLDVQQGPALQQQTACNSWFAAVDNKPIKWPNAQTISYTVIHSLISNHVHIKMWIEITDPFSNLTDLAAPWSVEMDT